MFSLKNKQKKQPPVKGFVKLTRVHGRGDNPIKSQPIMIAVNEIESFRPRNKIGTKNNGNRCALVTTSGKYINVAEKFSEVQRLLTQVAQR